MAAGQNLYVTEPDVIDLDALAGLLPADGYSIIPGQDDWADDFKSDADTLIIRSATNVTSTISHNFPKLQAIVRIGTGLDNVDLDYCKSAGIKVYNAPGANADAVAEYVVSVVLCARRKLHLINKSDILSWNRFKFSGHGLTGRTVGIIGYGNIGRLLHKKLQGLGCAEFLVYDPYVSESQAAAAGVHLMKLDDLLRRSDIISIHVPLTDETNYLLNDAKLHLLQEHAVLVNASRGGIVDESAVLRLLQEKDFTYIADTVEHEPQVNPELLGHDNIIITPHIASLTSDSEAAMLRIAVENYLSGRAAV